CDRESIGRSKRPPHRRLMVSTLRTTLSSLELTASCSLDDRVQVEVAEGIVSADVLTRPPLVTTVAWDAVDSWEEIDDDDEGDDATATITGEVLLLIGLTTLGVIGSEVGVE